MEIQPNSKHQRTKSKIVENYKKPTPKKWRKMGDVALLLAITIEPAIQSMPLANLYAKEWIVWGFSTCLILFKFYTNTKAE